MLRAYLARASAAACASCATVSNSLAMVSFKSPTCARSHTTAGASCCAPLAHLLSAAAHADDKFFELLYGTRAYLGLKRCQQPLQAGCRMPAIHVAGARLRLAQVLGRWRRTARRFHGRQRVSGRREEI